MKTKLMFEQLTRTGLIIILVCYFLSIPTQPVSAKPLADPFTNCATQTQIPETECNALVTLYTDTGGANWYDHTGWLQTDTPCNWYGVTCAEGTNVTSLSMIQNNLSGSIPAQLGNLTKLTTLELGKGSLTGSIPSELGSLSNLTMLALYSNNLSGPIPSGLGSLLDLTTLALGSNDLSGPIPAELANLTSLTTLELYGNQLSGPLPTVLTSLTNLTDLNLSNNDFTGSIPSSYSNLTNLTNLNLSNNALSGNIPTWLGSLTQLQFLYLSNNAFSGPIPKELGTLAQLDRLLLNNNSLSGPIPPELGDIASLTDLNLSGNALSGPIPSELGSLSALVVLYLDNNTLRGEFPTSIVNLTNLNYFNFDCELTSSDPAVITFIDTVEPGWVYRACPTLASPLNGATLDNGRTDNLDDIVWDFDWSDVPDATNYQLYVTRQGATGPTIDLSNIAASSYHYISLNNYITSANRFNWQWKTRAYINNQWGEWSETRSFSVEPPNTDSAQAVAKNGGFNSYIGTSRIPKFWKASRFSATDGKNTTVKHEGVASVKISGAVGVVKTLSQTLNVSGPAGDRFIFSYWVKGSAIPKAGVCQAKVSFYNSATFKGAKILKCPSGANYPFKKMTLNISAPAAYTGIVITFTYSKPSGTVWFDGISLMR